MATVDLTGPARTAAIVAVVAELERCRERWHQQHATIEQGGTVSAVVMETTEQSVDDLQAALDALRGSDDAMPDDAIERTVGRARDAYVRFLEANERDKQNRRH